MQHFTHYPLKAYNTFGIDVQCSHFFSVEDEQELERLLNDPTFVHLRAQYPDFVVLGKGSNILFTKHVNGLVLQIAMGGIEVFNETEEAVWVRVGAGIEWQYFVAFAVQQGWGGIENLSCIPGTVGAAPVQNIGAYGVEVAQVIQQVRAYHLQKHQMVIFDQEACRFGYRDSFFKREGKNSYIITAVEFKLHKHHTLQLEYGAIREALAALQIDTPTIAAVSKVVCSIRASKLPDPKHVGNAGSFFKNPVLSLEQLSAIQGAYPSIPAHASGDGFKVPAGWLIEKAGWKGYRAGDAGCYEKQALVLVNYGTATGNEVLQLAQNIQASVQEQFGVALEMEVNVLA